MENKSLRLTELICSRNVLEQTLLFIQSYPDTVTEDFLQSLKNEKETIQKLINKLLDEGKGVI